ncbi:MAG: 50S ribosomal protein L3 [Armatimonadetes bacterium]|nr:50S ribosomal protein L3 [Armatimonadota bacterium]MDW8121159.1 50S ribosomal protein L3 [Armatimonadota bacterium]
MAEHAVKGILGRKIGMTTVFDEDGNAVPVTVIRAGPCPIVQERTLEKDGYRAVQLGFEEIPSRKVTKPLAGHFAKAGVRPHRFLAEFPVASDSSVRVGDLVTVAIFEKGDRVKITAQSKGKGFAGVMKRWGFSGHPASHGWHFHRKPGSHGSQGPQRVLPGSRLPGHMGNTTITIKGQTVFDLFVEDHLLLIKGSVPGPNGALVRIEKIER